MPIRDQLQASLGNAYTLERELRGGGMAQVFLANEKALGRRVVVKMLPEDLVGSVNLDRFSREIQVAAHLQHPCILPVLSAGVADGVPYYTMPFVDGKSLQDRLADGGEFSIPEALKALRDLASGLAYAHDHGIVHRDIKPGNILLSDGYALITDFGVAKALSASVAERLTATGIAIGTPSYMSPEQATGDPHVDQRADIYAFGCVAYEMLVGQPPFAGRALQAVTAAHLTETPDLVTTHRPSVPEPLSRLIARCLEKRPADRPQSARELVLELDAIATPSGGATAAFPGADLGRSRTRRAAIAGGLIAIAALATVGVIVARRDRDAASSAGNTAHRVVVRTFKNNSGDAALDPIGPMAADWIARGLTETSVDVAGTESDIAARGSTSKTSALTPSALGRLMHARYVVSGSYYTEGDSLYLQAEVWDAKTERVAKSVPPVGDVTRAKTAVLEQLRQRVTGALVPYFDSSIVTTSRVPPRYEAYEEFVLANQGYGGMSVIAHLRAAVRLDPSFVYARLRLISALWGIGAYAARDSEIAGVAAMLDKLSPYERASFEARVALLRGDYDGAYAAAASGWRLAPNSTVAGIELGEAALRVGRVNEAARRLEALDPESFPLRYLPNYYAYLCNAYHVLDRMPDLQRCYDRAHRQYPAARWWNMIGALRDARDVGQLLDSLVSVGDSTQGAAIAVYELDAHGHPDAARAIARRVLARVREAVGDTLAANALRNMRMGLLSYLGEWGELARVIDSTPRPRRSNLALSLRGVASAMMGDTADARRQAEAITSADSAGARRDRARVLAALGDKQAALALLRAGDAPAYYWQYHGDIIYRLMRGYAPFEQFLKPRD